jgi:tetratricopeptide (TPR) repeat protein
LALFPQEESAMTEVTLGEYCEEIESLIDEGSFDAAISHCQHILKAYPKYLQAYRLLGNAVLEKGDLEAASDLYSRVLSMDPEDFVARVGMSIANDKEDSLDQAVWHMERAFELAPDNRAIAGELRRLHKQRDGREPEKVALSKGALARLHARGNLYTQATNELRQLLADEPGRVDLQVALAETLWRADRRIEAAETSLAILETLPYCLKANLILGEIWTSGGRETEGAAHLERARMIDPENSVAQSLFGDRSPLHPVQVRVERLEYISPPAPEEQEPDWLETLIGEGAGPAAPDEAIPGWLLAVAAATDVEETPAPEPVAPEPDEFPDWLQEIATAADEEAEEFAAASEIPDRELAESEMPDWLAELAAEPTAETTEPLSSDEVPGWAEEAPIPPVEEPEAAPGELPDWLAELEVAETEPPVDEEPEEALDELPDRLAELEVAEAEPPVDEEPEEALDELPDWLAELEPTEAEPRTEEEAELARAEIPDWLAELAPPEAVPSTLSDLDVPAAEVPEWLAEEEAAEVEPVEEEVAEAPSPPTVDETPDWLSELVEAAGVSLEEAPTEEPMELEEEALPDWLAEFREEQALEAEEPPIPTEVVEPAEESIVSLEGADSEAADAEAELMARLEDMSPEEAFAAWEAMLTEDEAEEVASEPEEVQPKVTAPPSLTVIEELEKEALVYPEGAGGEVSDAEAELMARLEDMSPEEAFAAWEAMLAEDEAEEVTPEPEEVQPEATVPPGPTVIEEPEKDALVYPEGAGGDVSAAEAELMASLEDMSPEEAFAAWEAMLAESEEQVMEEEAPLAAAVSEEEETWMPLVEDEVEEEIPAPVIPEERVVAEPMGELEQLEEALPKEERPPEAVPESDQPWMMLVEDERQEEIAAPPLPEEPTVGAIAEAPPAPEEADVELPVWAVAEAVEMEPEVPPEEEEELAKEPEWVWLTEEEETEVRVPEVQEPAAPPDIGEPIVEVEEEPEEEPALEAETPLIQVEPPARPTWVALEEEAAAAATPPEEEKVTEPRDDQERLQLARHLWAAGQREEAYAEYERLLKSSLLDDVITDLESMTDDEPGDESLLRLLGDAYMRDNRLDEALNTYRLALASI